VGGFGSETSCPLEKPSRLTQKSNKLTQRFNDKLHEMVNVLQTTRRSEARSAKSISNALEKTKQPNHPTS
jgi:hypothetical protein